MNEKQESDLLKGFNDLEKLRKMYEDLTKAYSALDNSPYFEINEPFITVMCDVQKGNKLHWGLELCSVVLPLDSHWREVRYVGETLDECIQQAIVKHDLMFKELEQLRKEMRKNDM